MVIGLGWGPSAGSCWWDRFRGRISRCSKFCHVASCLRCPPLQPAPEGPVGAALADRGPDGQNRGAQGCHEGFLAPTGPTGAEPGKSAPDCPSGPVPRLCWPLHVHTYRAPAATEAGPLASWKGPWDPGGRVCWLSGLEHVRDTGNMRRCRLFSVLWP